MLFKNTELESNNSSLKIQSIKRKERDTRHFAPANKEWKNSVYAYNKNYILNSSAKDQVAGSFIKSYFNLVPVPAIITKSKRMRDLIRSKTTKQLYVSKPEIKQNNDKAIITVYTYDREKVLYLKKLYFLKKWFNTNLFNITLFSKKAKKVLKYKSDKHLVNKYNINFLYKKKIYNKNRFLRYRERRFILNRGISKYYIKPEIFNKNISLLLKKKQFITNILFYHYLRWILFLFRIKISINPGIIIKKMKNNKKKSVEIIYLILSKFERIKKNKNKLTTKKKIIIKGSFNLKTLIKINIILLQFLIVNVKVLNIKETKIYDLFNLFKEKYYNAIARKYLKKEILTIRYMTKLYINKFKYYNYIPGIKSILNKIYDKKIQLNIINLKYLHMNSDLFTEAVSVKLKDRTRSFLRILRKSFKLIRTFKPNKMFILSEKNKNYVTNNINTYFGEYNVVNGNVLNSVFKKMFKNKDMFYEKSNVKEILTSLKYKWVTGVRIEAKGRLTNRYAAARALFKYKYRGTLRNLEHLKNVENKLQSPNVSMLRGEVRPNTQYTFVPSKRQIGAFGIKSWISNS